jgi:hypothetical protein
MKRVLALALPACWFALACNKEAPPTAEEPRSPAPVAVTPAKLEGPAVGEPTGATADPARPDAMAAAGTSRVSDATFDLSLRAKGDYAAGKPGELELVLEAKDPYHVNDKYPFKFTLNETKGVKFPSAILGKDQVKLEKSRAALAVPFTPETAGNHTVSGRFAFSVCSDDKCLMEKRELSLSIAAK